METQIAKVVRICRKELAQRSSTFFLVYTDVDTETHRILTKATSNSTPEGISAILHLLLQPTAEAVNVLKQALIDANCNLDSSFRLADPEEKAQELLAKLCGLFTIKGIEPQKPSEE